MRGNGGGPLGPLACTDLAPAGCVVLWLCLCLPVFAQMRGQGRVPLPNPGTMAPTGTITVDVKDEQGSPLTNLSPDSITATMLGGGTVAYASQQGGEEWVFSNLTPGAQYSVQVSARGFETAQQFVSLSSITGASERVEFFLLPAGGRRGSGKAAAGAILAPRAQKEAQEGIKDLAAKKTGSAQKHLAKALEMAPGNALVNYLMGASWLQASRTDKAIPYLEKAISLDPRQTRALMALGMVRYEQGDAAKAVELLEQAAESAPASWEAHWLLGAALLRHGDYEQASKQAATAVQLGKANADQARLTEAAALANLGKRDESLAMVDDYSKRHPNDPRAQQLRAAIAASAGAAPTQAATRDAKAAEQPPATGQPVLANSDTPSGSPPREAAPGPTPAPNPAAPPAAIATRVAPPPAALPPATGIGMPPDVDEEKPARISDAACDLPRVLKGAGAHAAAFAANLQKFSATEEFQEAEIGGNGELKRPMAQTFSYLAFIERVRPGVIAVDEMRTPPELGRAPLMWTGAAGLALLFDKEFTGDFDWQCEGLGEWNGQPAWMIHFEQRPERPTSSLHAFVTPNHEYRLALKGRAWVAANGNQVLHLETDLIAPEEKVRLERDHFAIDYNLVRFRTQPAALWLPERVDIYYRFKGHSYRQYSRFSNFELFWVGTTQKIAAPKQNGLKP